MNATRTEGQVLFDATRQGLAAYLRAHEHHGGITVCPSRRFVYMKPPKTAGTTVLRGVIEPHLDDLLHLKASREAFDHWLEHTSDQDLEEYFIFSVTRDPWDRFVSVARYFDHDVTHLARNFAEIAGADEVLRIHALPISRYTHIGDEPFVDFVCRFETLQADMNLVFDRIGLPRRTLPHLNPSSRLDDYRLYMDADTARLVGSLYREDVRNFGYSLCDSDLRPSAGLRLKAHSAWASLRRGGERSARAIARRIDPRRSGSS